MRAALYRGTGQAAEVFGIEEVDRPEPGPGEVLVRVHASGVNPTDYKARSGAVPRPIDDFQIPLGTFRLRPDGSAGGHNGLKSIEGALQSQQYARLRIGVGPLPAGTGDWTDYVLNPFEDDEIEQVQSLMPQMIESVEKWLKT